MFCDRGIFSLEHESLKLGGLMLACGLVVAVAWVQIDGVWLKLAYPWHYPLGTGLTLGLGILLGRKTLAAPEKASVSSEP